MINTIQPVRHQRAVLSNAARQQAPVQFAAEAPKASKGMLYSALAGLALLGVSGCNVNPMAPVKANNIAPTNITVNSAPKNEGVVVTGSATVSQDPDTYAFSGTVSEEGVDYNRVLTNMNAKGVSLIKAIKDLKLMLDVQSSVSVSPKYNYDSGTAKMAGYQGQLTLKIGGNADSEAEFKEEASKITQVLAQNNAGFAGPYFSLKNTEAAEKAALEKALKETVAKAQFTAETLGIKLDGESPFSIEVGSPVAGSFGESSHFALASAGGGRGMSEEAFSFKKIDVHSPQVVVRFNIEGKGK